MEDKVCRGIKNICYFTEGKDTRKLRVRVKKIPYVSVQVVVRKREDPSRRRKRRSSLDYNHEKP